MRQRNVSAKLNHRRSSVSSRRNKRATFPQSLVSAFEEYLEQHHLAPATIRNYLADVRGFVRWMEASPNGTSGRKLQAADLNRYRAYLVERSGQSAATVNRRLQSLRLLGRCVQEKGKSRDNPAQAIRLVQNGHGEESTRILDEREVAALVVALRAGARRSLMPRDYAIVELMLQAGLRVNEVAGLKKSDIVPTAYGLRLLVRGSSEQQVRQVPLNETLAHALREYIEVRPAAPEVEQLFVSQQGKPLSTRSIQRLIEAYGEAAQLEDVCANSLRHTCAKKMLEEKNPPEMVAQWLGYKNVDSLNRYRT